MGALAARRWRVFPISPGVVGLGLLDGGGSAALVVASFIRKIVPPPEVEWRGEASVASPGWD